MTTDRVPAGFTITELLVAMGILMFGTVSLLGVLGVGVQTHRSAEQHNQAVQLAQRVLQRLEEETVPRALLAAAAAGDDAEPVLAAVDSTPADVGFASGLRYRVGASVLSFAVTENFGSFNNTPDVGFQIGWAYSALFEH